LQTADLTSNEDGGVAGEGSAGANRLRAKQTQIGEFGESTFPWQAKDACIGVAGAATIEMLAPEVEGFLFALVTAVVSGYDCR